MSIPKILILFILALPVSCFAQFTITGRVLNQTDKKPIAGASVFLSNATTGGVSSENGTFILKNIKNGKYKLVISVVGFEINTQILLMENNDIKVEDVFLKPVEKQLKEVVIKSDPNRSLYLSMFKEQFLGKSDLATECKILNPEVLDLDFDEKTNTLTASSNDFLEIENDALGYKIKYQLDDFEWINNPGSPVIRIRGDFLFVELKGSRSEERRWQRTRAEVYENSPMHFFRAVLADKITEEGFKVQQLAFYDNPNRPTDSVIKIKIKRYDSLYNATYKYHDKLYGQKQYRDTLLYWQRELKISKRLTTLWPYALGQADILNSTNRPGLYAIGCSMDALYVTYNKQHSFYKDAKIARIYDPRNTETTLLSFEKPFAIIDRNGIVANPYDIYYTGVWVNERVADLLPIDYEPPLDEARVVDSTVSKRVAARLQKYSDHHNVEKVYLHLDKPYYTAGDTLYFKAYLTTGERHQLSDISGVVHVDLINTNNKIDQSINLAVIGGVAWGDFALPDSLPKGNYRVRAYTNLMRNDGNKSFFEQVIPVGSVLNNKIPESISNITPANDKPDMQFFPEGGELVTGVKSKVAFKAINSLGSGINVKGVIVDNDNKEVATLASEHLGMGYFYLTPSPGKIYKAKLTYANKMQNTIDLPKTDDTGLALSVNNDAPSEVSIKIEAGATCFKENRNKDYTLVIYSGGTIKNIIVKLENPEIPVNITKSGFYSGVTRITLFSPAGQPLAERLIFIRNDDQINLSITSDKTSYTKKEKADIKLHISNNGDAPTGHFSVSVIDENKVPVNENAENTILTNLLLTSDLKGYVEQPNYYFADESDKVQADLDLVMLTHGYRHFEWKQVLDSTASKVNYQPESSLALSGTIKTFSGNPIPHAGITLLSVNENIVRDTTADINGHFKFTDLDLSDTSKLVINAKKTDNSSRVNINLDKPDYPPVTNTNYEYLDTIKRSAWVTESMQKQFEQRKSLRNGIMLKQVNIKSAKEQPPITHSANLNGPGNADQVIMGDKLVGCPNLADCLVSRIHGARVKYGSDGTPMFFSIHTPVALNGNTKPMAVLVDGIIRDQSALTQISNTDVASIEILETFGYLTIYGSSASGGLIIINTKRGDEVKPSATISPGVITYHFKGFYKAREFYSPKYDHPVTDATAPDLRTTIFWKPEVLTDKDGNASFEYYNADGPGTYRVVVEGIDENGNIGRQVYRYSVK